MRNQMAEKITSKFQKVSSIFFLVLQSKIIDNPLNHRLKKASNFCR